MQRAQAWLPYWVLAALVAGVILTPSGRAGEVGYIEDFALAGDRTAALRQLVPGTEDFYYYHALHLLNTAQYDKVRSHTAPWRERFGQTPRLTEIETRHALLTYEKDPKASLEYLRNRLGLHFDHQKEVIGAAPNLPTALDPKLIARDALLADSFRRWQNLDNFEDAALDWLAAGELTWERRRHLLQRLTRPDVPNLPKLVADDLAAPHTPGFGGYPVHAQMTLPQLEELLKLRPELPTNAAFVRAWAAKLQPGADADWSRDRRVTRDYLTRLEAFVMPLPAGPQPVQGARPLPPARPRPGGRRLRQGPAPGVPEAAAEPAVHGPRLAGPAGEPRPPGRPERRLRPDHAAAAGEGGRAAGPQLPATLLRRGRIAQGVRAVHRRHLPEAPVRRDQGRERAGRPRGVGVAAAAGPLRPLSGPRGHRLRVHQQDRLRRRRVGPARPVRQERADAAGEGVRDQHLELLPDAAQGGGYRRQPRRAGGQRRGVAPVRRAAAAADGPALRVPQADEARRVRDRLHRGRQEQPGAGPQGPAAAGRRHRHRRADGDGGGRRRQAGAERLGVARRAGVPGRRGGDRHAAVLVRAGPPAGRAGQRRVRLPGPHRPPAGGLPAGRRHPRRSGVARHPEGRPGAGPAGAVPQRQAGVGQAARRGQAADRLDGSFGHLVVGRGAGLQAVRGPGVGPRVPRPAAAGGAERHPDREGQEPEPEPAARPVGRPVVRAERRRQDGQDRGPAPGPVRVGLRHRTPRPHRRGEAGPRGDAGGEAPRLQGAGPGHAQDRPARPGQPRPARGRDVHHRHRVGGHGTHLAAAARPAHLPRRRCTRRSARR